MQMPQTQPTFDYGDEEVDMLANEKAKLEAKAIRRANQCPKCSGTGLYGGHHWKAPHPGAVQGECFRCKGKGFQTRSDVKRNQAYDAYRAAKDAFND